MYIYPGHMHILGRFWKMSFNLQLVVSHNFDFGDCRFYKERILECAMRAANANNGVIAAGIHPPPAAGHRWGTSIYSTLDNLDGNKSLQFLQPVILTALATYFC